MSTARENFKLWYADIIRNSLFHTRDAGYVIVLVTFPLLERYTRLKTRQFGKKLGDRLYEKIAQLIPGLESQEQAETFWNIYRHRLLHWLTSEGWLSHDLSSAIVVGNGEFLINPIKFAERVLHIIEDDFSTFEGMKTKHALPQVTNDVWGLTATVRVSEGTALPFIDFKPK